jgi:hypothetical protein
MYGKVQRNYGEFDRTHDVGFYDLEVQRRIALATRLAEIAAAHGMEMYTCCGDYLIGGRISKAHCVDGEILERLYPGLYGGTRRPTRKECGCTESTDIGRYDTCPHGCIYCYANVNKAQADKAFRSHDPDSAFLGIQRAESERLVDEIRERDGSHAVGKAEALGLQMSLSL